MDPTGTEVSTSEEVPDYLERTGLYTSKIVFRLKTSLKVKVYNIAVDNIFHDIDFDEDITQVISPQTPETTSTLQQKKKNLFVVIYISINV